MSCRPISSENKPTVWPEKPLSECIDKIRVPFKASRKDFLEAGAVPIVSQEAAFINGYWNNEQDAVKVDRPVVVFGDHTQALKLIDFDFVVGADGVKILKPKSFLDAPFLRYFLESNPSPSLGYARHYRLISKLSVPLPPLDEQKRIVAKLDQAFAALDRARIHAEANLADVQELFDKALVSTFDGVLHESKMMTLASAAKDFSRGKSRHRPRNDPALYGGDYPFIQTGDIRKSDGSIREYTQRYNEVGLAQSKLWPAGTVCITIAANIAETGVLQFDSCFPDSVIGMVPDPDIADPYYVEYMLRYFSGELKLKGKGAAQDNINLGTFESAQFPFPSLPKQKALVELLDGMAGRIAEASERYSTQLADITTLRQSLLQQAFSGQLT